MKQQRRGFLVRQLLPIAALLATMTLAFAVYAQKTAITYIENTTRDLSEITARDADTFTIYFQAKLNLTQSLCSSLRQSPRESWNAILRQAGQINGNSVFVVDTDGVDVLSGESIGADQALLQARFAASNSGLAGPGYDPLTGKRATFAYSSFTVGGGQTLLVLAAINSESLYDEIDLSLYDGNGYSYIVDADGYTVLYSRQPDSNKTFFSILQLLRERKASQLHTASQLSQLQAALKTGMSGVGYYLHDGRDCVVSVAPIRIAGGWNVITVVDETYLYSVIGRLLTHTLAAMLVILACFAAAGIMIYKSGRKSQRYQQLNAQLQEAKQEAEQANSAKSDFLSRMSHDIRTPMNTIINLTRLMEDELGDREALLRDLHRVETASEFLLALINDILDMSRIERGKIELHPEIYPYAEFLDYISSTFSPLCDEKRIHFQVDRDLGHLALVIDKVRLNQICFNLLSNAVKYTPAGGAVGLKIRNGAVQDGHSTCHIYVSDTGIGMSEAFQQHMFEPFDRESNSMAAVQGSGLGLSIVKELVQLMGGSIQVQSAPGAGTMFLVCLNVAVAEGLAPETSGKPGKSENLSGRRVLVVEDHPLNQQIAQRLLKKGGILSLAAGNGAEAVELFQRQGDTLDAILMDLRMPVMDGLSATRAIRALDTPRAKTIPIIAMTANAFQEDRDAAAAAGMNGYLSKPVDPQQLFSILRRLL